MFSIELQIKRLTLTAEARIIHRKERKQKLMQRKRPTQDRSYVTFDLLREHRLHHVRPAARAAHLAHAILRGHAYAKVEHKNTRLKVPSEAVAENLRRFGPHMIATMEKKLMVAVVEAWILGGVVPVDVGASNPRVAGSTPAAAS